MAIRACEMCGASFDAKTAKGRFCSSTCRGRAHRGEAPRTGRASLAETPEIGDLERATRGRLEAVDRHQTVLGVQALGLARRIDSPTTMDSAMAALSKEFRAVMVDALDGVAVAADPLDELRGRRERKRAG